MDAAAAAGKVGGGGRLAAAAEEAGGRGRLDAAAEEAGDSTSPLPPAKFPLKKLHFYKHIWSRITILIGG